MQAVLSIDATTEPAIVSVIRLDGANLEVVETHRISLERGLVPSTANQAALNPSLAAQGRPQSGVTTDSETTPTTIAPLDLTSMVTSRWNSAVVIIPGEQYHSLNVNLPFNDPRKVNKIIDLEVQDLVPFDVGEFILQHRTVHANSDGTFDVHVSIMPRERLAEILAACKEGGVEPAVVSTATSVIAALPKLYPSFPADAVVIMYRRAAYYLTFILNGEVRTDRIIDRTILNGAGDSPTAALAEIRLSITAVEHRYGRTFEKVFLLDTPFTATEATAALERPAAGLALPNISGDLTPGGEIAALSTVFVRDREPITALTNFRTREFAYNLQLSELWRGLTLLRPYFLVTLLTLAIAAGVIYFLREQRIARISSAVRSQIVALAPEINAPEGRELDALMGKINLLDQQLKDLGSPTRASPLDALLLISRDLPADSGITVSRISVKGSKITFDASGPSYSAAEGLKSALEKKRQQYCRVRMESSAAASTGQNSRGFRFEVYLCD